MIPVAELHEGQWITTTPHGPAHQVLSVRPGSSRLTTVVCFADGPEPVTYGPGARLYPAAAPERSCCDCGELLAVGTPAYVRRCSWCAVAKFL